MSDKFVSYSESNGIATIAMDDGKANALSTKMIDELNTAFDQADASAVAVVLVGREQRFCAGFDLRAMMAGPQAAIALFTSGAELLMRLYEFSMPLVVGCTGHAIAGGVLLAATGDTRIGALGEFKIGLNEVQNGMPVPILAHELARDRLLPTELLQAVVQAKIYTPEEAAAVGWLDLAVAPEDVLARAQEEATRLSKLSAGAYGVSKRSLRRKTIDHIRTTLDANITALLQPPK